MLGRIVNLKGGFYYIMSDRVYETRARGNFRHLNKKPVVGDYVEFRVGATTGYIDEILQRKNLLLRPVVANVDAALVVVSMRDPEYNLNLLDKILVNVEREDLEIIICFNKSDLKDPKEVLKIYKHAGFDAYGISAQSDGDLDFLKDRLRGKTTALIGASGAGKSTLASRLLNIEIRTGDVSSKTKRGRHTTRHVELFYANGIYLFDTPGFSSLKLDLRPHEIKEYFREFKKFSPCCKFNDCNHANEPGCAVKEALSEGSIEKSRYENYLYYFERGEI